MALEGTIKDFGLPDIFQLIGLQRKTGILTLTSANETVTVTFENGMVVNADSTAKRLEDRLGYVLVKQGKLVKERLEEALQTQRATLQRLGHILIASGQISHSDLKEALHTQASQIVFKVFRWRDGQYLFAPTELVDYDREYFTPLSADFILMEGIRMVDEWPIIEKKIPSMDIVFRSAVDPSVVELGSPQGAGSESFGESPEEKGRSGAASSTIRLTEAEERIYSKVDGTRTVQGVIDATGLPEFEVCRVLFDLLNRSIIAPVGRGEPREAVSPRKEAAASPLPGYAAVAAVALLSLAGLAYRIGSPFAVTGLRPFLKPSYQLLLEGVRYTRLERLDRALLAYQLAEGEVPRKLEELPASGLADRRYLRDPWGRPYHYAFTERGYMLSGEGPDRRRAPETVIERALPPEFR